MKRIVILIMALMVCVGFVSQNVAAVDTTYVKVGTNVSIRGNWFETNLTTAFGVTAKYVMLQLDDSLLIKYKVMCGFRYTDKGDTNKIFMADPVVPYKTLNGAADTLRLKPIYVDTEKDSAEFNFLDSAFVLTGVAESGRALIYEVPPRAHRFCIFPMVTTTVANSKLRLNVYRYKW